MIYRLLLCAGVAAAMMLACHTKSPNRDHIPELQERLFKLQQGIAERNPAAIDSLLSLQILDIHESSDSLLSLVYGPNGDYPFAQLGNYEFFYTDDKARIDCSLIDTAGQSGPSIKLTLVREHGMWLFKRFELKTSDSSIVGE